MSSIRQIAAGIGMSIIIFAVGPCLADVVGSVYLNNAAGSNAVIGFSHGAADATFSLPSPVNNACTGVFAGDTICLDSGKTANGYTLGGFLSSSGATVLTHTATALDSSILNSVYEFTGMVSVVSGQQFQAGHDDGLQLKIGDVLVIDAPGGTAFTTTPATYTGPTGTFAFDLVYGECCGAPAALGISLPFVSSPSPEPAAWEMMVAGLVGFGISRRRAPRRLGPIAAQ